LPLDTVYFVENLDRFTIYMWFYLFLELYYLATLEKVYV